MKNIFKLMLHSYIIFSVFTGCTQNRKIVNSNKTFQFRIAIKQDGITKDIISNEAAIYRKPFTVEVIFAGADSIFLNASLNSSSFIAAVSGNPLSEIPGYTGTVVAEELFNREELLTMSDSMQNFWNYSGISDHRFSDILEKNGIVTCSRKISFINHSDKLKEKIKISDIKSEAIYLVFMKLEWNKDYKIKVEKKRIPIKLIFMDVEPGSLENTIEKKNGIKNK